MARLGLVKSDSEAGAAPPLPKYAYTKGRLEILIPDHAAEHINVLVKSQTVFRTVDI
jgi:hypothetical protein